MHLYKKLCLSLILSVTNANFLKRIKKYKYIIKIHIYILVVLFYQIKLALFFTIIKKCREILIIKFYKNR